MISRENDKDLSQLLDGFPMAVFLVDSESRILFANRACSALVQRNPSKLENECLSAIVKRVSGEQPDWTFSQSTPHKQVCFEGTVSLDGRELTWAEVKGCLIKLKESKVLMVCVSDATEKKRMDRQLDKLQSKLIHADRVEMAGIVAGQVAHDFKNLLSPILGLPEFIKAELPEGSKAYKDLMMIQASGQRMADITQQLLTLARRGFHEHKELNVNDVVVESLQHIRSRKSNGIEVALCLDPSLPSISGEFTQLMRAIFNLLLNAIDALGEEGKLTIATEHGVYPDIVLSNEEPEEQTHLVRIAIQDTGVGIPETLKQEIFRPFYTTKKSEKDRGSGIGLSVVQGVVRDHGGRIEVESMVGQGTTFYIYLPIGGNEADT